MIHSWEQDMLKAVDSRKVKIKEYLPENAFMLYVDDMGDTWAHAFLLKKFWFLQQSKFILSGLEEPRVTLERIMAD
jgi:hypothetical protein